METYTVYTALNTEKSPSKKTVTLKAESFFQAAANAAHFLGWPTTDGLKLQRKEENLREYRMGEMTFDVLRRVTA